MKSQCLELAYQEALQNTELIVKDEASRRLRLQILLLENENDEMHRQLATGEDRIDGLEEDNEDLRAQLDQAQEDTKKIETELRVQTRELNNVKVFSVPRGQLNAKLINYHIGRIEVYEWSNNGLDEGSYGEVSTQPRGRCHETRTRAPTFASGTSTVDTSGKVSTSATS